jgi:hypothetical protein
VTLTFGRRPMTISPTMAGSRLIRRCLAAVIGAVSVALVVAASAVASRAPTRGERAAIARVARHSPRAGSSPVLISRIRVSTVGPWASAVVTSYTGHHDPDTALDILHKRHGRWRLTKHSPGTAGVSCGIGMPRSDQRNLGVICTHGT